MNDETNHEFHMTFKVRSVTINGHESPVIVSDSTLQKFEVEATSVGDAYQKSIEKLKKEKDATVNYNSEGWAIFELKSGNTYTVYELMKAVYFDD